MDDYTKNIDLSVVIACYNEEPVLRGSVADLIDVLNITRFRDSYELIFVDDCSHDATLQIIHQLIEQHPHLNMHLIRHTKNTGRGRTVTDGLLEARGRIAGFLDIDLETPAHYIPAAVLEIERGADVVSALRIYKFMWRTLYRHILSVGYHDLEAAMLGVPLKDTEVGFKFFNRERALTVLQECQDPGWFWDTEVMARSYFSGLRIVEMPTLFIKRYDKQSSVRIFHDSFEYLQKLLKFRREATQLAAHYRARGYVPVQPGRLKAEVKEPITKIVSLL